MSVGGNLLVTNGGVNGGMLKLYSGPTNGTTPVGLRVSVGGTLTVATNAIVYVYSERTNGGSAFFTTRSVNIAPGGTIDANGRGFAGVIGQSVTAYGNGPGRGKAVASNAGGGGYGGKGGNSSGAGTDGGTNYGSAYLPLDPGSSGGAYWTGVRSGDGGGFVGISASIQLNVDGTIAANGWTAAGDSAAGGSGGGIYLYCRNLTGHGVLSALGRGSSTAGGGNLGGGGGGRIAVWTHNGGGWFGSPPDATGTNTVGGGPLVNGGQNGPIGTVFFGYVPLTGTLIEIR